MSKSILILGDLVIDETWYVEVTRLNPEAPTPTAELTHSIPHREPGGAGFAAAWAASQGLDVTFVSAIAPDNLKLLHRRGVHVHSLNGEYTSNITKTRFIERNSGYHLLRLDNDRFVDNPSITPRYVIEVISEIIKCGRIDVCLLSDYCKGFFNDTMSWDSVLEWLEHNGIPTLLDTRAKDITSWFSPDGTIRHAWLKLNDRELKQVLKTADWNSCQNAEDAVRNQLFSHVLVTHGKDGASSYEALWPSQRADGQPYVKIGVHTPILPANAVPDPTGCGDIFDISFISSISDSLPTQDALKYAVDTATKFAYIPLKDKFNG